MRKSYYLFGMFLILLTHTLILGMMLSDDIKLKANQESKNDIDFFSKRNMKLYPSNRVFADSTLIPNRFSNRNFVIK